MTTKSDMTLFHYWFSEIHSIWHDWEKHRSLLDTWNKLPNCMTNSGLVLKK